MKEEVKKEKLEQALNEEELAKATGGYAVPRNGLQDSQVIVPLDPIKKGK